MSREHVKDGEELLLYLWNTEPLYNRAKARFRTLARAVDFGARTEKQVLRAVAPYGAVVTAAAIAYVRELLKHEPVHYSPSQVFPASARLECARQLRDMFANWYKLEWPSERVAGWHERKAES